MKYCKIPIICHEFFAGLILGEPYFRKGLLLEGFLHFIMSWRVFFFLLGGGGGIFGRA